MPGEQLEALWNLARRFEPEWSAGASHPSRAARADERPHRLSPDTAPVARDGLPTLVWAVLIGGGVVTVVFTYFFGLVMIAAQLAMTALYVSSIGFVLFLVAAMDYPYTGIVKLKPHAMELVLR